MKFRKFIVAGTAAAAILGSAGTAMAVSGSATTTYHGCERTSGTPARIIFDVYTTKTPVCPSGSFAVTWNQSGPQGPAGPKGATGAKGATGPQGPAGQSGQVSITATTTVTNWPETSGWATDAFTRTLTETVDHAAPSAKCGGTPQCWFITGQLADNGTFQTVSASPSPNGSSGATISGVNDGTMQGTADFEFYSSSNKLAASNVPVSASGPARPASTTAWGELGFPAGTTFAAVSLTAYDWDYVLASTCEQWNDQVNPGDDGQSPADGNITGASHCTG